MYDIAFIGSGIASSMTLCHLAECLKARPDRSKPLRIGIIEKEGEMWTGVPYGQRSVVGALAFQKLDEFLEEPERRCYIEWLVTNAESWLTTLRELGGAGAAQWISDNQSLMDQGKWGELYLPRFLFGMYVSTQAAHAVEELAKANLASVTLIRGEATDIRRVPGGSQTIAVESSGGTRVVLNAAKVVVAIGSPPQKAIDGGVGADCVSHLHLNDIYLPSEESSMQKIHQRLASLPDPRTANILILGSNASALEILYLINYRPAIRKLLNSVVIFSHSGLLPYKICEQVVPFELRELEALRKSGYFSAADLMAAITCDIRAAEAAKLNIADLRDSFGTAVSRLIALMNSDEQEEFVCEHGVNYSRMMRRAGRHTRDAADQLVDSGILTTMKGRLARLEPSPSGTGEMRAVYASAEGQAERTYPTPFCLTINCGGFEELDISSSRVINSLIANNLCRVNRTKRGFMVNERMEASENIYVIGPLLGGNFNRKIRFWHVESALRIAGLAKLLADSLTQSLSPQLGMLSQTRQVPPSVRPQA